MSIRLELDKTDNTILHLNFEGRWTWQQFSRLTYTLRQSLPVVKSSRMDFICDLSRSDAVPPGVVRNLQPSPEADPIQGITIIVGGGAFVMAAVGLLKIVNHFSAQQYFTANNIDEARRMISEHRNREPKLKPLPLAFIPEAAAGD
jgi:hypothetical protein